MPSTSLKNIRFYIRNDIHFPQSTLFFTSLCYYWILTLLRAALFWDFAQRRKVVFLPTYRDNVSDPWRWDPIGFPETSVSNYYSTLHKFPKKRRAHLHPGGGLKSRIAQFCLTFLHLPEIVKMHTKYLNALGLLITMSFTILIIIIIIMQRSER
jgi:hypothetical protein